VILEYVLKGFFGGCCDLGRLSRADCRKLKIDHELNIIDEIPFTIRHDHRLI
jgi:hypothetical protein